LELEKGHQKGVDEYILPPTESDEAKGEESNKRKVQCIGGGGKNKGKLQGKENDG